MTPEGAGPKGRPDSDLPDMVGVPANDIALEKRLDIIDVAGLRVRNIWLFFSSWSLKMKEKCNSFAQLVLLSLYIF